jgi:RNA polymerase sigma factor (sigma-70 family)
MDDRDLIEAIGRDPQTGIEAVMTRYGEILLGRITRRAEQSGHGNAYADDVFMESLESLVEPENRAACLAAGGAILPWLTKLAYWRLQDAAKKALRAGIGVLAEEEFIDQTTEAPWELTDEEAEDDDLAPALDRAFPKLSPKDQEFLHLQFNESYSSKELAESFGISEGAVRKATFDARRRLEKLMKAELELGRGEES